MFSAIGLVGAYGVNGPLWDASKRFTLGVNPIAIEALAKAENLGVAVLVTNSISGMPGLIVCLFACACGMKG